MGRHESAEAATAGGQRVISILLLSLCLLQGCIAPHEPSTVSEPRHAASGTKDQKDSSPSQSVQLFARVPLLSEIKLSPSGKYLGYLLNQETGTSLVTRSIGKQDDRVLITTDNSEYRLRWFEWAGDERLLASVAFADTRGRVETMETRLVGINRDGTEYKAL
ncbi:hypothetical protein [Nitrospira sp. Nam74]